MMSYLTRKELFISVLIHTVIFMCFFYPDVNKSSQITIKNKVKIKPIESYLYNPPQPVQLNKTQVPSHVSLSAKIKPISEKATSIKRAVVSKTNQNKITNSVKLKNNSVENLQSDKQLASKKVITKQTLNAQIKNIHKYLPPDNKPINQRSQIKSIFNPNPALVPKSTTVSLKQREQKRKQQITNYSQHMAIKKDDEGNCTMRQDLTSVGIEGVIATQHFKCGGKTQFEKRFSQHMKSAMDRYK